MKPIEYKHKFTVDEVHEALTKFLHKKENDARMKPINEYEIYNCIALYNEIHSANMWGVSNIMISSQEGMMLSLFNFKKKGKK